jgi:hypothetical protein
MSTQRYSKQDAIDGLKSVADKIDKSPTKKEYQKNKKDKHPSVEWIADNFSSWNNLKTDAGLDVYRRRCTKQDYIDAIKYVADKIGKSPSVSEYKANKKDHHPGNSVICNNLGSWNNAKELAGLDILNSAGSVEYSKKDAINALQSIADEIGKSPSQREYIANKKDHHPSSNWIKCNLGSWNNAKDTAGLKKCDNVGINYKDKELFLRKIKKQVQCKECGLQGPNRRLHFHHVKPDTKVEKVTTMVNRDYSMEELKAEIKKCEILCDTCHGHEHTTVTKEDCINALQWVVDQLGDLPTEKEYQKHKKDHHPNKNTIRTRLDSWSEAKETVNLEPTQTTLQSDFESPSRNDA